MINTRPVGPRSRLPWSSFRPPDVSRAPPAGERHQPGSTSGRRRRPLALGGALLVVVMLWGGWRATGAWRSHHVLVGTLFVIPGAVAAIAAALAAAARCAPDHATRAAWRLLAWAGAAELAGLIVQALYEWHGSPPFPSGADAFQLGCYVLIVAGLLRFAAGRRTGVARVRFGLDLATVTLAGGLAVAYVLPGRLAQLGPHALTDLVLLAYPVGDLIVLGAVGAILLRRTNTAGALSRRLLAGGALALVAADLILIGSGSAHRTGDGFDLGWMIALGLLATAGSAEPGIEAHAAVADAERPPGGWAPYLATLVGFGLLIADHRSLALVIITVVIGILACARQLLASSDLLSVQRLASHDSTRDPLTGLPNRRELIADLEVALETASPTAQRTLALFDLDGFKHYNDTFGHPAGDQLLARLAGRLAAALPPSGRAYRLGGDEFGVLVNRSGLTGTRSRRSARPRCPSRAPASGSEPRPAPSRSPRRRRTPPPRCTPPTAGCMPTSTAVARRR